MLFYNKSDTKINWPLLLIETLLVVLSVLLALGLNSWRENRSNEELAERALKSVVEEYSTNCSRINTFQDYHKEVATGKRESEGLQVGLIQNSAWDAARSTGAIAFINYETASVIEQIYVAQGDHRSLFQSYIEALLTRVGRKDSLDLVHSALDVVTIRELVRIQESLIDYYFDLKDKLEETYADEVSVSSFCN
jgi:hypothetical protein